MVEMVRKLAKKDNKSIDFSIFKKLLTEIFFICDCEAQFENNLDKEEQEVIKEMQGNRTVKTNEQYLLRAH